MKRLSKFHYEQWIDTYYLSFKVKPLYVTTPGDIYFDLSTLPTRHWEDQYILYWKPGFNYSLHYALV